MSLAEGSNLYEQVLNQLKVQEQVAVITVLGEDGQFTKHLYQPGMEAEDIEALVQEACYEGRPVTGRLPELQPKPNAGVRDTSKRCQEADVRDTSQRCQEDDVQASNKRCMRQQTDVLSGSSDSSMIFVEPFTRESRMILLGGGHVSLALEEFAARTGFAVTVVDDRLTFANKVRFPLAKEVLCEEFGRAIEKLDIHRSDYVVLLTRGHRHDGDCLRSLAKQEKTVYLGMIGSRRRVRELKDQLAEEGVSRDWLESIHTPVGLDIGAVTPEEIAIAILAEVIMVKRKPAGGNGVRVLQSDIDMEVTADLAQAPEKMQDMRRATVTIMETKGSTPRKAGAKMIVYENGMIQGTIGGGCAEANLMQYAREIIRNGGYKICHVDMTGTVAEDEGMVCGGTMQVLIECV